ncbi:hypothetical protein ACQEU8_19685 [Streptomyces sp. CA-250714]|uniref:hypothetical protein n=1 Tax=Streptomyces sp. CA-250714 TaxID=3240060 RepID=UPI003D906A30
MSFQDEWARSKESATAGLGTGYRPGLVVRQDDLGKVGSDAYTLYRKLKSGADIRGKGLDKEGKSACERAANELARGDFDMGDQIRTTLRIWDSQLNTLLQACARIADHLDYTKKAHARDEVDVMDSMRQIQGKRLSTSKIYDCIGGA